MPQRTHDEIDQKCLRASERVFSPFPKTIPPPSLILRYLERTSLVPIRSILANNYGLTTSLAFWHWKGNHLQTIKTNNTVQFALCPKREAGSTTTLNCTYKKNNKIVNTICGLKNFLWHLYCLWRHEGTFLIVTCTQAKTK